LVIAVVVVVVVVVVVAVVVVVVFGTLRPARSELSAAIGRLAVPAAS